jgi:hypothetical protein
MIDDDIGDGRSSHSPPFEGLMTVRRMTDGVIGVVALTTTLFGTAGEGKQLKQYSRLFGHEKRPRSMVTSL